MNEALKRLFGGKEWFRSMTAWGLVIIGAVRSAEGMGLVPAGTSDLMDSTARGALEGGQAVVASTGNLVQNIGALLVVLGLRKAATAKAAAVALLTVGLTLGPADLGWATGKSSSSPTAAAATARGSGGDATSLVLPNFPAADPSYAEVDLVCTTDPDGKRCEWGMDELEGRRTPWICRKVLNHIPMVRRVC